MSDVSYERQPLQVGGVDLSVATAHRAGDLAPIVFLHGFGSTKEDYLDIARHRAFAGRPFLAYDATGSNWRRSRTAATGRSTPTPSPRGNASPSS